MLQALGIQPCSCLFISFASNGLEARNPQCPREHGIPQGSRTRSREVPAPATSGTVFCGQGYGWPKKTPGPPVQNTSQGPLAGLPRARKENGLTFTRWWRQRLMLHYARRSYMNYACPSRVIQYRDSISLLSKLDQP